jgi:hypothetical protein
MAELVLSGGVTVQSEKVRHAEYYPRGSLMNDGFINGLLIKREKDFLFIRLSDGIAHIRGNGAAEGADAPTGRSSSVSPSRGCCFADRSVIRSSGADLPHCRA